MVAHRRCRGLTLLELLLVMVVVALSVSLVYVALDGLLPSTRLGSAAREIGAAITLAQQEAVLRGQQTKVEYDLGGGKVRVMLPGSSQSNTGQTTLTPSGFSVVLAKEIQLSGVLLSADEVKSAGVVSVSCQPTGGVTAHIVHLKGQGALVYSIQVHALTGAINFHDTQIGWPAALKDGN